jgi:hypothetical protein
VAVLHTWLWFGLDNSRSSVLKCLPSSSTTSILVYVVSRTLLELIVLFKLASGFFTFISTAAKEVKVGDNSLISPIWECSDKIALLLDCYWLTAFSIRNGFLYVSKKLLKGYWHMCVFGMIQNHCRYMCRFETCSNVGRPNCMAELHGLISPKGRAPPQSLCLTDCGGLPLQDVLVWLNEICNLLIV